MGICFQGKLYIGCISNLLDAFPYLAYLNSRRFILQGCGSGWIGRIRIRNLKKLGSDSGFSVNIRMQNPSKKRIFIAMFIKQSCK